MLSGIRCTSIHIRRAHYTEKWLKLGDRRILVEDRLLPEDRLISEPQGQTLVHLVQDSSVPATTTNSSEVEFQFQGSFAREVLSFKEIREFSREAPWIRIRLRR